MRIDLEEHGYPGEWIEIPDRRGWMASKQIQNAALRVSADPETANGFTADVDLVKQGLLKLAAISEWSFADARPGAAYFESDAFPESLGETLIEVIDGYYESIGRSEEERKS